MEDRRHLFSPLTVRDMTIKNRLSMSPMGTNFALCTGEMSARHVRYYEKRAAGGTGMIIVENANVSWPGGANGTTQLRIDQDRFIPRLYELCEAVHRHSTRIALQINHAGGAASTMSLGVRPVSASNVPAKQGGEVPRPLSREEIEGIVRDFGQAALRAKSAGFDAVEVHAGHSYLLCQFLSPLTNHRTDEFGGSPENRARFARLVLEEVRHAVGEQFPLIVRISADEMIEGGNTLDDTLELLGFYAQEADLIDVSCGLSDSVQYQVDNCELPDGWRAYLSRAVRRATGKPTIVTGNIRDPEVAERIIARGDADLCGIGRGLIADPEWARKVRAGREDEIRKCISCNIGCAYHRQQLKRPIRCTVNPQMDTWETYKKKRVARPCTVVVVGGGVAGLEAACTAAEVGCTVFALERDEEFGGLPRRIARIPSKFRMQHFVAYQLKRAQALENLSLLSGTEPSESLIKELKPDLVVNATGAVPLLPPIEGLRAAVNTPEGRVFSIEGMMAAVDKLAGELHGATVAIAGGGAVGLDVMEFCVERGARAAIVSRSAIGEDLDPVTRSHFREVLRTHDVKCLAHTDLVGVEERAFRVVNRDDGERTIPFDYGFVCLGLASRTPRLPEVERAIEGTGAQMLTIGDAKAPRRIIDGIAEGRAIVTLLEDNGWFS